MKKKILLFMLIIINNAYCDCGSLNGYYNAVSKYIETCQSIGTMPSYYGEPNGDGTPQTTAKITQCIPLLQTVHVSATKLGMSPVMKDFSELSCPIFPEQKVAPLLSYKGTFGLNATFGLLSLCDDPFIVNQVLPAPPIPLIEFNQLLLPGLCGF